MWIYYNLVEQDYGHQKRREPESQRADVMYSGHTRDFPCQYLTRKTDVICTR